MRGSIHPIAIVGMACQYPDAASPRQLWENVLAQRRSFRRLPPERLRLEDYYSADRSQADAIYATQAALIDGYEFDRVKFRVVGSTFRSADLVHWLALDVAAQALADAGFEGGAGLDPATTGVVLGNSLTGEFSRAELMRYRWPYVRRQVAAALAQAGWTGSRAGEFLADLEREYKGPFPAPGDESLAGGLSNTIAGRICNHFDFKGGGYTVDGACASSLLATTTACSALINGDLDVALAGGVDLSLDPFELVGFSKVGALAEHEMRVYDARSAGFWPGEGCGVVVLMRYEDALAAGRRIYALVQGWGVSSDGAGGITRPEQQGQLLALRRAYQRAGFGAGTVGYFEGHGTGTTVGDLTELRALMRARLESGAGSKAAIGSIKANIGHTKAAAGVAGLIKATLVVHNQVLPPTAGCVEPHPELFKSEANLRVLHEAEPWPESAPLRAGVSAMGFGGINTHLVLEGPAIPRCRGLASRERKLSRSSQDAELFLFDAIDHLTLLEQVRRLRGFAARVSLGELTDLAAALAGRLGDGPVRAAVIASRPDELAAELQRLEGWLLDPGPPAHRLDKMAFLGSHGRRPRIGFLFPGQASPSHLEGGLYRRRFDCARELYARGHLPPGGDSRQTAVAQPAIVTASLGGLRLLQALGIEAELSVGHSLGELTALHWAGAWDEEALLRLAEVRGRAMGELGAPTGAMAGIGAGAEQVRSLLNGEAVRIAGYNSPRQTVVSGQAQEVALVVDRAQRRGWQASTLPVSHAFHSPLVAAATPMLAQHLAAQAVCAPCRPVASTVTGQWLGEATDVRKLLADQVTSPVRFIEAVALAGQAGVDLWIEVGPGRVLSGLMEDLTSTPVIALDASGDSLRGLLQAVAAAFVLGGPVRPSVLFEDRHARPFDLDWSPRFLSNPCERAPLADLPAISNQKSEIANQQSAIDNRQSTIASWPSTLGPPRLELGTRNSELGTQQSTILDLVRGLVAARAELPLSAVTEQSRLLGDLHLNSISIGQLVGEAARLLGLTPPAAPSDYAQATVGSLTTALEERKRTGGTASAKAETEGVGRWLRAFEVVWIEQSLESGAGPAANGHWEILGTTVLAEHLRQEVRRPAGRGTIVCLSGRIEEDAGLLLSAGKRVLAADPGAVLLVVSGTGLGGGFLRSLHLESGRSMRLLTLSEQSQSAERVWSETAGVRGFSEVRYDRTGRRLAPRLRLADNGKGDFQWPLGKGDVVVVTGGGKGIAAECGLALARRTGASLALLGRARPEQDAELKANLERLRAAAVRFGYYAADVSDAVAVQQALRAAEQELGPLTGFVHGAGVNVPALVDSLTAEAFLRTLAPKVEGARNVMAALDPSRLRLLVTFGSIIARLGLRGEADYATANEWLRIWTEDFQREHPVCRCLALEWSVWSGVGMGERLGRVEALAEEGITAITPDEGVDLFCQLTGRDPEATALVLTGRFGDARTLALEQADLPLWRFLERPRVYYPGVELVVDFALSPESDPYANEHILHGERLLPAVMGLEAMAQAAMVLARSELPPSFEAVHFERPLVVPRQDKAHVRLAALATSPDTVEVSLRSAESGLDHFRARCRFGLDSNAKFAEGWVQPEQVAGRVDLDPAADLYEDLLFHTGRFRRVLNYRLLRGRECLAQLEADMESPWFGHYLSQERVLGDTGVRDAAIHAIQACIPHARLLPVSVESIVVGPLPCLHRSREGPRPILLLHARERSRQGDLFYFDARLMTEDGRTLELWTNLALRRVEPIPRRKPWPATLLANHVERRLEELCPGTRVDVVLARHPAETVREQRSLTALRQMIGEGAILRHRPDGKPELEGGSPVSAAHHKEWTLAVVGDALLGCDLEAVCARPTEAWTDLLGKDRWGLAQRLAADAGEDVQWTATRLWLALESFKKGGLAWDTPLQPAAMEPDGWLVLRTGSVRVATLISSVRGWAQPAGLAVAVGQASA